MVSRVGADLRRTMRKFKALRRPYPGIGSRGLAIHGSIAYETT